MEIRGCDFSQNRKSEEYLKAIVRTGKVWTDSSFPPEASSICGRERESKRKKIRPSMKCRCGLEAKKSKVERDTPNKGRSYARCALRRCGFFVWLDDATRHRARRFRWTRFPTFVLVSDYGFSSQDLLQGGIGDCWFLSALAVVAERHDLLSKLFVDTARNIADCFGVRLFLDGRWRTILVDGQLPCTDHPTRKQHVRETNLAFSRTCKNQLWVSVLEKAYAKAYGSYAAISGGEVAEALLDLTGAPTYTVDFSDPSFDLSRFWRQLCHFRARGYPMGCGTAPDPQLREVGLCGSHAYSILDVRDIVDPALEHGRVRLLRVRNPHGVGEWKGEWSDASERWSKLIHRHRDLHRTGINDGTFWIDLTHFVMAFSVVDVCFARRDCDGFHTRSFENRFPPKKKSPMRICENIYFVRSTSTSSSSTLLHLMMLQPAKRGSWCRSDRKVSYKPGDLSVLILRLKSDKEAMDETGKICPEKVEQLSREGTLRLFVCQCALRGSYKTSMRSVGFTIDPFSTYIVIPLNLGSGPSASSSRVSQPFQMRFCSDHPVSVLPTRSSACHSIVSKGFHEAMFTPWRCVDDQHIELCSMPKISRFVLPLSGDDSCEHEFFFVRGPEGVIVLCGANLSNMRKRFEITAKVKVMCVRCCEDPSVLLKTDAELSAAENVVKHDGRRGRKGGYRWVAKWRVYRFRCSIDARSRRVIATLVATGVQHEFRSFQIRQIAFECDNRSTLESSSSSLERWLGIPSSRGYSQRRGIISSLFSNVSMSHRTRRSRHAVDLIDLTEASPNMVTTKDQEARDIAQAIEASLRSKHDVDRDNNNLAIALIESTKSVRDVDPTSIVAIGVRSGDDVEACSNKKRRIEVAEIKDNDDDKILDLTITASPIEVREKKAINEVIVASLDAQSQFDRDMERAIEESIKTSS